MPEVNIINIIILYMFIYGLYILSISVQKNYKQMCKGMGGINVNMYNDNNVSHIKRNTNKNV